MQFHPFARRFLALVLTAAFMTTAALSGFAVYAMPIQAAYPQESIYLFDADTGEALVEQNPDLPRCVASLTKMMTALLVLESGTDLNASITIPASLTPELQSIRANRGHTIGLQAGETELSYLRHRDRRLGAVIDRVGYVDRAVDADLFSSVVHHIIGQQISTKAQATVWRRMQDALGEVNAQTVLAAGVPRLQGLGMTFRKAAYITDFAGRVQSGAFDLDAVQRMDDAGAIRALSELKGIGVWTAEMILLFCMQRPDVLSYDDLAIRRGLRMVYRHRSIDRALFEKYRRRYSPYGSVASLYLWAVSGGAIPELSDPAPKK